MRGLNADQFRKLSCCIASIHADGDPEEFPIRVLKAIVELLAVDCAGYNEIAIRPQRMLRAAFLGDSYTREQLLAFERHIHEHPLIGYTHRHPGCRALCLSDFLTKDQFHRTGLYNEFFRRVGVEHQMAVGVASRPGAVAGIALNRRRRDFSDTERAMLDLLRPHLRQAHRTAQLIARLRRERKHDGEILEHAGFGSITVGSDGSILSASLEARRLLSVYYPAPRRPSNRLPPEIGDWLGHAVGGTISCLPLVEYRPGRWLMVRLATRIDGAFTLLFREHSVAGHALQLQALGLTPRQAEVVAWLVQGKTDREIGYLLGLSPRTVEKHVENIIQSLGVESRIKVMVRAGEVIG